MHMHMRMHMHMHMLPRLNVAMPSIMAMYMYACRVRD